MPVDIGSAAVGEETQYDPYSSSKPIQNNNHPEEHQTKSISSNLHKREGVLWINRWCSQDDRIDSLQQQERIQIKMAVERSLKGFATIVLIMEIFFSIIYAFEEGYAQTVTYSDFNGLIATIFLCMLLLIGFGLMTVYIKDFAISGLVLNFIMLAFTIQWYFLLKKFWYAINLTDTANYISLADNPNNIRLSANLKYSNADPSFSIDTKDMKYFTLSQAVCCAISMFVIFFAVVGRAGPAESILICLVGNFGYTLNEAVFWRLNISDNGYGMKIFLFGSIAGIIASIIIDKREETHQHSNYLSSYEYQTLAFIGAIFAWILLPWLSYIDQSQADATTFVNDFRQIAPLNIMYALSASASMSFSASIWLRGKISVHDVIFGCISGAVAYGSSSNVFPNPWPAMFIGTLSGMLTVYFNSKKQDLNKNGIVDSLGVLFVFLIPSFIGAIFSAILFATTAYGPLGDHQYIQADGERSRWAHGGYQMAGLAITFCIAGLTGLVLGALMKIFTTPYVREEMFNDDSFIQRDAKKHLQQTKIVKVSQDQP